jgi:hypothetical protein
MGVIVVPSHVEVDGAVCDAPSLLNKILREMLGRTKEMAVNINRHSKTSHATKSFAELPIAGSEIAQEVTSC